MAEPALAQHEGHIHTVDHVNGTCEGRAEGDLHSCAAGDGEMDQGTNSETVSRLRMS